MISHERVAVTNDSYSNAYSVCKLLIRITQKFNNLPISIALDNTRYQKWKLVKETAKLFDIELLYLRPYAPNFNPIERLWKFVKKKCLYSRYYSDFGSITKAILQCLKKTDGCYKKELSSFLFIAGEPLWKIQGILRHKNPSTTERYLRTLGQESARDAMKNNLCGPDIPFPKKETPSELTL